MDICKTGMLPTHGKQTIFGSIGKSQCLRRKLSVERGSWLMDVLIHGFLLLSLNTFSKLPDK